MRHNENIDKLPPYLFAEMDRKKKAIRALIEQGKGVWDGFIPLAVGDPDLPTPKPIIEAMKGDLDDYHGYPDYEGLPQLREAIADYYMKRADVCLSPDDVYIGIGAKNDLFDFVRVFSRRGDIILVQDPSYPVYVNSTIIDGRELRYLPCVEERNFIPQKPSELPPEFLTKEELQRLSVVFLCNPNNPTGASVDRPVLERFIEDSLGNNQHLIVHDIAYWDFQPNGRPFVPNREAPSIFEIQGAEQVAIECGSFSKPYSMTDKRLSWVIARGKIGKVWGSMYRTNRDSGVSHHIQVGGVEALRNPDVKEEVLRNMQIYGERADVVVSGLRRIGINCRELKFTPYVWARVPQGFDSLQFADKILEEAYVGITPGIGFGEQGKDYFRLTIFQPKEKLQEAIYRMEKTLKR